MQDLRITSPGPDGHTHIVYINTESGAAGMSPAADGHVHDVIYDPPREPVEATPEIPPQIDPMTGMPVINPETGQPDMGQPANPGDPGKEVGTWIVRPAATGGQSQIEQVQAPVLPTQPLGEMHEHELLEYVAKPKKTKESDKDILADCMSLWREALELTSESRKKGRESEDFYAGKQWDDDTSRWLNKLDRAALTINEIASNIDTLIGYQMEQRTDLKFLPQESGDQRVGDMLNIASKKILDACYFQREESKVFKDICITGFGDFNMYMSFTDNIQGDVKVERFQWDDAVYGPHEKEDLSDCEYGVKSRMQSIAKLKQWFGKKANEIEASYKSYCGQYPDIEDNKTGVSGTHMDYRAAKKLDDVPYTVDGTFPLVDVQRKQFRLAQVTRKTYKEVTVIFNQDENFFFTAYDWKEEDIAKASSIPGFQVISQMKTRMRITKFCGNVILSDENPADLPVHDFYSVPVYAYRQNGEFWGKVEAAKDPQRELNKRRSQIMDTMNRLGASVYYTEPDTFTNSQEKEKFKKNRSKPGSMFEVNDLNRKPVLESGADVPVALVNIMQMDQENLQRLMNVVVAPGGANESGALFLERKKGRLTGNQFLFDNLSFAKQKIGKLLLGLIQRYYPPERLLRLLNSQYSKQKFEIGGEDFSQFSEDEVLEMLENADLLEYDVIVSESSFAPSTRLGIAMTLFDLMEKGAAVPPELPLEFIDMPNDTRMRITQGLQQQAQQSAQSATETSNSEITKTLIAKGQYTVAPEKAQELGLVPVQGENPLANGAQDPNNVQDENSQATAYANDLASALAG